MPKTKGTKRGAEAVADASAKKGRRASEADVALRLGDELGEHTIVSLANIILLKIAADLGGGRRYQPHGGRQMLPRPVRRAPLHREDVHRDSHYGLDFELELERL